MLEFRWQPAAAAAIGRCSSRGLAIFAQYLLDRCLYRLVDYWICRERKFLGSLRQVQGRQLGLCSIFDALVVLPCACLLR